MEKPSVMFLLPLPRLGEGTGEGPKDEQARREPNSCCPHAVDSCAKAYARGDHVYSTEARTFAITGHIHRY